MRFGTASWVLAASLLVACHGRETDEVIAGLRADNDRLRGEIAALRVENAVQLDDREPHWPVTASLKRAGGSNVRTMYRRECPNGQALKGFSVRSGSVIDAVVPLCAPVTKIPNTRGNRTLERELPIVGGRGGKTNETTCPGNGLMNGLRGRSAEVIDALEPICEDGKSGPRVGGEGGRDYERLCPVGWVAVGITGRQGDYLESLSLTCADPSAFRTSALDTPEPELDLRELNKPKSPVPQLAVPADEPTLPEAPPAPPERAVPEEPTP